MPTYQYACTSCGEQLEAVQRFSDEPLTECPACGGRLRKVFSPVGVVFKGSGFYKTDSRASGKKTADAASGKSDDKAAGSGGDKAAATTSTSDSGGGSGSGESSPSSPPSSSSSSGQVA